MNSAATDGHGPAPFRHVAATFLYVGHAPIASGTWGTAAAMVPLLFAPYLPDGWFLPILIALTILCFVIGIPAATWAEREYGKKDPGQFVLDEAIGIWIGVAWLTPPGWQAAVIAFFAFRLFDIAKVYPGNRFEALPGGYGIILDDVVAGFYTLALMIPVRLFLFP